MENKSFIEWIKSLRKPSEVELWCLEMKRERKCNCKNCETIIHGWDSGGLCRLCFVEQLQIQKTIWIYER